jgi:hypothetical protein
LQTVPRFRILSGVKVPWDLRIPGRFCVRWVRACAEFRASETPSNRRRRMCRLPRLRILGVILLRLPFLYARTLRPCGANSQAAGSASRNAHCCQVQNPERHRLAPAPSVCPRFNASQVFRAIETQMNPKGSRMDLQAKQTSQLTETSPPSGCVPTQTVH